MLFQALSTSSKNFCFSETGNKLMKCSSHVVDPTFAWLELTVRINFIGRHTICSQIGCFHNMSITWIDDRCMQVIITHLQIATLWTGSTIKFSEFTVRVLWFPSELHCFNISFCLHEALGIGNINLPGRVEFRFKLTKNNKVNKTRNLPRQCLMLSPATTVETDLCFSDRIHNCSCSGLSWKKTYFLHHKLNTEVV